MAAVQQASPFPVSPHHAHPYQPRTVRAATAPPTSMLYTRPWRSSPLAGPGFSTLPPIISESSEELEYPSAPESVPEFPQCRSPDALSIVSQASAPASTYSSRNASGSASALALSQGYASTSSISLPPSTAAGAHAAGTPSPALGPMTPKTQTRPARLSKSPPRRPASAHASPRNTISPPPRARTLSHGHSRSASLLVHPVAPTPSIPPTYSRASQLQTEPNTAKPSVSRDPASNWMSSAPFGPVTTPRFSRLSMASPAVVMPLSASEYRKRKYRESHAPSKEKEAPSPASPVTMAAFQHPNGPPLVKVSPPPADIVQEPRSPPSSSGDHPDHRAQPEPQGDHPPPKRLPHSSLSAQPQRRLSHPRPRPRPTTPPRSSPLAAHPPISPKSSAGTFYSVTSTLGDEAAADTLGVPPARPRPRLRRKSYPGRLSDGARLSLSEAMNRLSQESTHINRLSVASQASGQTLFYDVEPDGAHKTVHEHPHENADGDPPRERTSLSLTQSLEDLSSALHRTGIELVRPHGEDGRLGDPDDDARKSKRNVRMVRISDTVEVSPAPAQRRRKLTKARPGAKEGHVHAPTLERRASLLPWKSKSGDAKGGVVSPVDEKPSEEGPLSTPTKNVDANESIPPSLRPGVKGSPHIDTPAKLLFNSTPTKAPSETPTPTATPVPSDGSPSKTRRNTFSFLTAHSFRSKREKTHSVPPGVDLGFDPAHVQPNGSIKGIASGTDSTPTSIHTITQPNESSPNVYDLTTLASSGGLSGAGRGASPATVPMLRRVTAQEMEVTGAPLPSEWDGRGASTPSLVTNRSTTTTSSVPRTPTLARHSGAGLEPFVHRPSALKESLVETSEEESEGVKVARVCVHRKLEQSPVARGAVTVVAVVEEDEEEQARAPVRTRSSAALLHLPRAGSRPGTSSSTVTTATETETSVSYASFSTVPASSAASSTTSRSTSPTPTAMMGDKGRAEDGEDGCALCGHVPALETVPASPPPAMEMHPMFTVPLVTVPASAVYPPWSGRHVSVAPAYERHPTAGHTRAGTDTVAATPAKVRKRRPQTAPAGHGDAGFTGVDEKPVRVTKPKGGESRLKAVLKGLLRWGA